MSDYVADLADAVYEYLDPHDTGWAAGDGPSVESVVEALLAMGAIPEREPSLEDRRQSELVRLLGQGECSKVYQHRDYERCPDCGAQV